MRDLMMLGAMLLLVPLSLRSSFSAYLLWGWAGLIAVQTYLYGFMREVPYVQMFALITLTLLVLSKDKEKSRYQLDPTTILMVLFALHCILAATLAYPWLARNWELSSNVLKTILFCLIMPVVITRRYRFHALLVVIAIGISIHGLLDGLKFLASGGAHRAVGVPKLGDNNHMAMILIMVMPLLLYLFQYAKYRIAKLGFAGAFLGTCLAVVATGSRGALITLVAVGAWLIMLSQNRMRYFSIAAVVGVLIVASAPDTWTERMDTIKSADQDSSFMGRITAWKRASAIALQHPAFGGGFHAGQDPQLFLQFNGENGLLGFIETPIAAYPAATHSIYFEVMGDLGFLGFFLFLALMLMPFMIRSRIKTLAKEIGPSANWARDCADMIAASMVAYLVGGAALSAAYFELPYITVMLMQVLYIQLKNNSVSADSPFSK